MKTVKGILDGKGRAVHTIAPAATVLEALKQMSDCNIGALVVVEGERIVGVMSERDYARKVILKGRFSKDTLVREIMHEKAICIEQGLTVEQCMGLMTDKRIRHLPVLVDGKLDGLVSIGDVVKAIIEDQQFTIEQLEQYIAGS